MPLLTSCAALAALCFPVTAEPAAVELADTAPRGGVYALAGSQSFPAGAVEVTVRNPGGSERGAQIVRVRGRHDATDALAALRGAGEGKPLPPWLQWAGGVGVVRARSTATFTVDLRAGRYFVVDRSYEGRQPKRARPGVLTVKRAGERAQLPPTSATIVTNEYGFQASGLRAGRRLVALRNAGAQPHDVVVSPILPGRTLDDVRAFAAGDESAPPPVDFSRETVSGVLAPGGAQTLALDLRPGRYALLCFASDRDGGPPHAVGGMVAEAQVG